MICLTCLHIAVRWRRRMTATNSSGADASCDRLWRVGCTPENAVRRAAICLSVDETIFEQPLWRDDSGLVIWYVGPFEGEVYFENWTSQDIGPMSYIFDVPFNKESQYEEFVREGLLILSRVRGIAVGWGTVLQVWRSRFPFWMEYLEFFIDLISPTSLWPWGRLSLEHKCVPVISYEGKDDRCLGLTTLPPSCVDCLEILGAWTSWNPKDLSTTVMG
jgi:hypothetical protein